MNIQIMNNRLFSAPPSSPTNGLIPEKCHVFVEYLDAIRKEVLCKESVKNCHKRIHLNAN